MNADARVHRPCGGRPMRAFSLLLVFLFSAGVAMADDRALDVTIKVVESPADLPGAVTKNIQLPPAAQKSREKPAADTPGSNNSPGESKNRGRGSTDDVVGENAPGKG